VCKDLQEKTEHQDLLVFSALSDLQDQMERGVWMEQRVILESLEQMAREV